MAEAGPIEPTTQPTKPTRPKGFVSKRRVFYMCGLVAVLVIVLGSVHIVYGGRHTLLVCKKSEWSLGHTFIAADDAPRVALRNADVYRALIECIENR